MVCCGNCANEIRKSQVFLYNTSIVVIVVAAYINKENGRYGKTINIKQVGVEAATSSARNLMTYKVVEEMGR